MALDHADKLLARLLVGELGDVGARLMGPRGGSVGGQAHVGIMSRADAGACAHGGRDLGEGSVRQNVLTGTWGGSSMVSSKRFDEARISRPASHDRKDQGLDKVVCCGAGLG